MNDISNCNKYVIITPSYNEGVYIRRTIESVISQTIIPIEWIIVDDESIDNTSQIVQEYANNYPWIKYIKKKKNCTEFGANIVEVFYHGFNLIVNKDYNFIVKLDADLDLIRNDYFEFQLKKFHEIESLGISSGVTYYEKDGKKILVDHPAWRTTGALKMYRRECFQQIGGITPIFGWDGLDEYKAMYRGWLTRTFKELEVLHLKKHATIRRESYPEFYLKKGKSFYRRGYPHEFILLKSLSNIFKLKFKFGFNLFRGYYAALLKKEKVFVNRNEKWFVRKFQFKRIFFSKRI